MKHCQSIKPQGRENKQGLPTCQATNLYFEPCWSLSKWGYWATEKAAEVRTVFCDMKVFYGNDHVFSKASTSPSAV